MDTMLPEFDYFSQQPIQTSVTDDYYVEVNPLNSVVDKTSIQLEWKAEQSIALSLKESKLVVKCKVLKVADNGAAAADALVAPTNNFLASMFEAVDFEINGKQVSEANKLYSYRAFFETFLSYGEDTINKRGILEGWALDTSGAHNTATLNGANVGFNTRRVWAAEGKLMTFVGRPHLDLFHQERCLPPGCGIKLMLTPSKSSICLMTATDDVYKVQISTVKLLLRVKKISPSLELAQSNMLLQFNFKLPYTRVSMTKFTIPNGSTSFTVPSMYSGPIPSRVVFGIVDQVAVSGQSKTNPFLFENLTITSLLMNVNGNNVPRNGLKLNFTAATEDCEEGYINLLESMDLDIVDRGLVVTPAQWMTGYTLFAFRLSPEPVGTGIWSLPRTGTVSLAMQMSGATAKVYDIIALAEYPSLLEIDRFKNLILQ